MGNRNELIDLIQQLPDEKIPEAMSVLKKLIEKQADNRTAPNTLDTLDTFMAVIVHSITNTMYDLSIDARRKDEMVMAKRLETYRKKVSEGWETYKGKKEISRN